MRRCADLLDDIGDPHGVGDTLAEIAEEIGEEIADDILIADFHAFLADVSPDDFRIADGE
ncbi:MAG: hypothetical protein JHC84_02095 [Solirubrobacteraceae bacterium]|nr:hypothetical protein [Solirubrobacteraceae bacterium]